MVVEMYALAPVQALAVNFDLPRCMYPLPPIVALPKSNAPMAVVSNVHKQHGTDLNQFINSERMFELNFGRLLSLFIQFRRVQQTMILKTWKKDNPCF